MTAENKWHSVCPVKALPEGAFKTLSVGNFEVMILNLDGEFHAIEVCCTVDGAHMRLEHGRGDTLICPHNGVRFDIRNGMPLAAPAYEPLAKFQTRTRDGTLEVYEEPWA